MTNPSSIVAVLTAVVVLGSAALPVSSSVAAEPAQTANNTELMQEVHALRVAIERLTASGARAQILLVRLQMQEQRVATLGRQAEVVHERLLEMQRNRDTNVAEIKALTGTLNDLPADERARLAARIDSMRRQIKQFDQQLRDLEAQDALLTNALAAEQGRWQQFSDRLDELERVMGKE